MKKPTYNVALALVRNDGQWLVARRPRSVHLGGLWEFPGGKCHASETPAQAALRELLEECGVQAEVRYVLDTVPFEYEDRIVHLTPVLCRWLAGRPQALASEACRWVSDAELDGLDMPAVNAGIIRAARAAVARD